MGKVICNYAERLLVSDQIQLSATLIWGYFPKWNWGVSIIKLCSTPTKNRMEKLSQDLYNWSHVCLLLLPQVPNFSFGA